MTKPDLAQQLRECEADCDQLIGLIESAQETSLEAVATAAKWRYRTEEVEIELWLGTCADPYAAWR